MRINFLVYSPDIHGGGRVTSLHAGYLKKAGHTVNVITLPQMKDDLRGFVSKVLRRPQNKRPYNAEFFLQQGIAPIHASHPNHVCPDDVPDADVTVATWWETGEWLMALPPEKGLKVHFIQGNEATFPYLDPQRAGKVFRTSFPKITISNWLVEVLDKDYGQKNVSLVHNGVNLDQFSATDTATRKHPTVGFLHSEAPRKNSSLAYAACRALKEKFPALRAEIFGHQDPASIAGIEDWMTYHRSPPQDKIADIYARCTAWFFTSEEEGFGLPILEAMACKTPVVATPAGAAPDLVSDRNGALVRHDLDAFVAGTSRILEMNEQQWRALSQAAFETASHHSWERASAEFEKTLQRLVAEEQRAHA